MNALTRWSRTQGPLRAINPTPVEAPSPASIVPTAAAILREELQSLTASGAGQLLPALMARLVSEQPGGSLGGQVQPLVDALSRLLGRPSSELMQLINVAPAGSQPDQPDAFESMTVLTPSRPVAAGEVARLSLRLQNDDADADECAVFVTDLIGPSGRRIPATHVRVIPQQVRIPGQGAATISLEVRIPSDSPPGSYAGLLQTDDGDALRALVHIAVGR